MQNPDRSFGAAVESSERLNRLIGEAEAILKQPLKIDTRGNIILLSGFEASYKDSLIGNINASEELSLRLLAIQKELHTLAEKKMKIPEEYQAQEQEVVAGAMLVYQNEDYVNAHSWPVPLLDKKGWWLEKASTSKYAGEYGSAGYTQHLPDQAA